MVSSIRMSGPSVSPATVPDPRRKGSIHEKRIFPAFHFDHHFPIIVSGPFDPSEPWTISKMNPLFTCPPSITDGPQLYTGISRTPVSASSG